MKLVERERVTGTRITLGRRVYYRHGRQTVSRWYAVEYRDANGVQHCRNLATTNRSQARRLVLEIKKQLETGSVPTVPGHITIRALVQEYLTAVQAKGIAPTSLLKYRTDLDKLRVFCHWRKLSRARNFSERSLYQYRQWLAQQGYADKTVQGAVVLAKQLFKWAWRQGLLRDYRLGAATFPQAKALPQPCFTSKQVDQLIEAATGEEKLAFALMGYMGLRIGEVQQLQWQDVYVQDNHPVMLHIQRGGSHQTTKNRRDRFVPVHPVVEKYLKPTAQKQGAILPHISERRLLDRLKYLCEKCGFDQPRQYKLHSFRHHFASLCANHHVAYRKALAWLGHRSSDILDLYYHLHDDDSRRAMQALAHNPQDY